MKILDPVLDMFRGKAVAIPPMDGALKPNTLLEDADVLATVAQPDNLIFDGVSVLYASGSGMYRIGVDRQVATFKSGVSALAISASGMMAVGLESGTVIVDGKEISGLNCPTAMAFDGDTLIVCNGSDFHAPQDWARDLMLRKPTGSIWRMNLATGGRDCLARGLAYPHGVVLGGGRIVFSESWKHCLSSIAANGGAVRQVLPRLPAYPCRITPIFDGYLLALFAPLNRLVEFVLQEDDYREDMMREIESRYWIAPMLAASQSFLEPLQNGGVRSMGVHKPWSPTRSYGLLVKLDKAFQPVASFHSRANGRFHGVTSAIEVAGSYIVTSKGGNAILGLTPAKDVG